MEKWHEILPELTLTSFVSFSAGLYCSDVIETKTQQKLVLVGEVRLNVAQGLTAPYHISIYAFNAPMARIYLKGVKLARITTAPTYMCCQGFDNANCRSS
jgi:hypothetical protein